MLVKIHKTQDSFVVAICDKDLIGKTLKDKNLTLKVSEHFYKGEDLNEEEVLKTIEKATNINILGKKSIAFALKHKIIKEENIIKIQNAPHAQIYS